MIKNKLIIFFLCICAFLSFGFIGFSNKLIAYADDNSSTDNVIINETDSSIVSFPSDLFIDTKLSMGSVAIEYNKKPTYSEKYTSYNSIFLRAFSIEPSVGYSFILQGEILNYKITRVTLFYLDEDGKVVAWLNKSSFNTYNNLPYFSFQPNYSSVGFVFYFSESIDYSDFLNIRKTNILFIPWRKLTFFDYDKTTILHTETLTVEFDYSYSDIPTRLGYDFLTWEYASVPYNNSSYSDLYSTSYSFENSIFYSDTYFYAIYEPKKITYNFYNFQGEELYFSTTIQFGNSPKYSNIPILGYCEFLGWGTSINDSSTIVDLNNLMFECEVVNLYAIFDYSVAFYHLNNIWGDVIETEYYPRGALISDYIDINDYCYAYLDENEFQKIAYFNSDSVFENDIFHLLRRNYSIRWYYKYYSDNNVINGTKYASYYYGDSVLVPEFSFLDGYFISGYSYYYPSGNENLPNSGGYDSISNSSYIYENMAWIDVDYCPVSIGSDFFNEQSTIFIRVNYSTVNDGDNVSYNWTSLLCSIWQGESSDTSFLGKLSNVGENLALLVPRALYNFFIYILFGFGPISKIIDFATGGLLKLLVLHSGTLLQLSSLSFVGPMFLCILFLIFGLRVIL